MRTQTEIELDSIVDGFQSLVGGSLRQFRFDEKCLQLQWACENQFYWVTFSMKPGTPFLFVTKDRIRLVKNLKKPLGLFLKTHLIDSQLTSFYRNKDEGRVIGFDLITESQEKAGIVMSLVPGRVNIEVSLGEKKVFANKPQPLPENHGDSKPALQKETRTNQFFVDHWEKGAKKSEGGQAPDKTKALKKKQQGLKKMEEHLEKLQENLWQTAGDWLKTNQALEGLPPELSGKVDLSQDLAWNIENCFASAKKNQGKVEGTKKRIEALLLEIQAIEQGKGKSGVKKQNTSLLSLAQVKGRTLELPEGRVFIGKSGKENLALLRKAKAWYLWIHIKDYPGAHGIVEKNKGGELSGASLEKAAREVVKQSLPKSAEGHFQVIYTECRYVRPIKGAKSGQVTYSHEKVMGIKVDR